MRGRGSRGNLGRDSISPPGQLQYYDGPMTLQAFRNQSYTVTTRMSRVVSATSNGSGVLSAIINNDPSNYTSWADFTPLFDEYRVLAMEVHYVPNVNNTYNTTYLPQPVIHVWDRDASGALTSLGQGMDYESAVPSNINVPFKGHVKMTGSEDSAFINTAAPVKTWSYFNYASGLTASTTYGSYFVQILVQFRGRV